MLDVVGASGKRHFDVKLRRAIEAMCNWPLMQNQLIQAGLLGDSTLRIDRVTAIAAKAGQNAAREGACFHMSPAERGRLRAMVAALN